MPNSLSVKVGQRAPQAFVAELDENGAVRPLNTDYLFAGAKVLQIGVPGAFTPICTAKHLPPFIERADTFRSAGYKELICISPSDPFSMDAWGRQLDPQRKMRFVSDGNLSFTRAAGLCSMEHALFLGERSKRYAMVLESAVVRKLTIENSVLDISCTGANHILEFE